MVEGAPLVDVAFHLGGGFGDSGTVSGGAIFATGSTAHGFVACAVLLPHVLIFESKCVIIQSEFLIDVNLRADSCCNL